MDVLDIPPPFKCQIDRYVGTVNAINLQWQTWTKPRGASMVHILCVGSGAGGGGGATRASGNGGGGGGGASSSQSTLVIPAHFLPDTLYLQVGAGGAGATAGGTGGAGILSYVAIAPSGNAAAVVSANVICASGSVVPGAGTGGSVGSAGAGGTAGTPATLSNMPIAALGVYNFLVGSGGTGGGAVTNGAGATAAIPVSGLCTMGGFGGGGSSTLDQIGGAPGALADSFVSDVRPRASAAGSFDGSSGFTLWKPFFNFSGVGGSSSASGAGGNGGNGAFGAGGGGGGSGTTGGRGGNGGPGVVFITSW